MPSSAAMKAALQAYIDHFNAGDADAVAALFADDATIEDPVGSPPKRGRAEIDSFYRGAIATGAKLFLELPIRGSHGHSAAMAFRVTMGTMTVHVIDVMTFDESGKFSSMKAYFGPDDIQE